jgi:hypothetical protein
MSQYLYRRIWEHSFYDNETDNYQQLSSLESTAEAARKRNVITTTFFVDGSL